MKTVLTETEKLSILAALDADNGQGEDEQEAKNHQIKAMCLVAKAKHFQKINQRRKRYD